MIYFSYGGDPLCIHSLIQDFWVCFFFRITAFDFLIHPWKECFIFYQSLNLLSIKMEGFHYKQGKVHFNYTKIGQRKSLKNNDDNDDEQKIFRKDTNIKKWHSLFQGYWTKINLGHSSDSNHPKRLAKVSVFDEILVS